MPQEINNVVSLPRKATAQTQPRRDHGSDHSLTAGLQAIAQMLQQLVELQSPSQRQQKHGLTYEEAEIITTLTRSKLEEMVRCGRFKAGRHYIKEGTRVIFSPNLLELMFMDKLEHEQVIVEVIEKPQLTEARQPVKHTKHTKHTKNVKGGVNLNYRGGAK